GLTDLYSRPSTTGQPEMVAHAKGATAPQAGVTADSFDDYGSAAGPLAQTPQDLEPSQPAMAQPPFEAVTPSSAATLAAAGDAEVICIIRDRNQPEAPSRVVIIDRASPTFLNYLGGEVKPTAMESRSAVPQPSSTRANRIPNADSTG